MGQLAFGVVGAVIGTYAGVGPAVGWAVGSAIGGVVFAPDGAQTTGPRLEDLKSNVSTYGQPVPRCYGQIGFMGSLIWMDDLTEYQSVEEASKGGDPASQTTFTYSASFAMILCRGESDMIPNSVPVQALNRIWINEKCYYDVRDDTNTEAIVASGNFAQYFTFYPGTQTQEPDPTMEAILGVGNVPAYRGRAYIVFTDLPLAFVQNQPPGALRIVFEVTMTGTPVTGLRIIQESAPTAQGAGNNNLMMPVVDGVVRTLQQPPDTYVTVMNVDGSSLGTDSRSEEEEEWPIGGVIGDVTQAVTRLFDGSAVRGYASTDTTAINNASMRLYAITPDFGTVSALPLLLPQTDIVNGVMASADQRHIFVFTRAPSDVLVQTYHLLKWLGAADGWELVKTGAVLDPRATIQSMGSSSQGVLYYSGMAESNLRWLWNFRSAGVIAGFYLGYIADDDTLDFVDFVDDGDMNSHTYDPTQLWADNGLAYAFIGNRYYMATRNDGAADNDQTLQEVFEAETALAGLSPSQVDGSFGASIIVDGMFVRRLGATRGVLQALEPAYFWDTVESSGVLKGVLRGGASAVTIEEDDLGASTGGQADEDLINPERADDDSLPGEVIVTYIDRASDYQVAAQHDRRSAVETDQPVSLEMPLVFTPDAARQIGAVWMYNQWAGRTRRVIRVSRSYSYLEPTDVITIRSDVADFVVRIISVKTSDGYIELECVDEDAALYDQNSEGAPVEQGSTVSLSTPSKLLLLDIPMLRESDNDGGFYVAAAGYSDSWPGAAILRSTDGGVTYVTVASFTTPTTIGTVASALGNFTGPLGYDSVNTVTVNLFSSATLQSCTDAELLAGANAFAIGTASAGYEIAQFKTATLVSGNTWTLKQLLRGRRGTERLMSTHSSYENFVLLQASRMRRIAIDDPATGVENHYKAVTFGQLVANASTTAFTNTSAGLKPYSPVNGRATGFGGDIAITWTRRGRIYNDWHDAIELPLGEVTESYSIDIYSGVTVIRTLTSSTPTVTYTTAQQTTDWGSPQPMSLSVRIYQLSAIVGRGFPLIATLS